MPAAIAPRASRELVCAAGAAGRAGRAAAPDPARRLPVAEGGGGGAGPAAEPGGWRVGRDIDGGDWLASRTSPAASTVRGYAAHVRLYLGPYLGEVLLTELTTGQAQAMFTAIIRQHQALGTPVSAATLTRIRATLRAALNAAIRRGLISENPAAKAELPRARRPPSPWPSSPARSGPGRRSCHPAGERVVPAVVRGLVERRLPELVVAGIAGDHHVSHAPAALGGFPGRRADARLPAHPRLARP